MYIIENKELLNIIVDAQVIQVCLGAFDVQIYFQDDNNSYIKLVIGQPDFISVDSKKIASVSDYSVLLPIIDKVVSNINITDDNFKIFFDNIVVNISLENNGYEIFDIYKDNNLLLII